MEAHQARRAEEENVVTAVGLQRASIYNDPRVCNIVQESEPSKSYSVMLHLVRALVV